ncbi:MAG: WYL domain-containing protein [Ardenticatenia bacterium]|nr:WYL domain-containing protein [Ardenticatenia bacterium]
MTESIRDKQARLLRLTHLLYRHPNGLTVRDMSRICGVSARTIQRDLKSLEESGVPIWQDEDEERPRYGIVDGYYIPPLQLTLGEATALYLAARLLCRHVDERNPHIVQAMAQLATVLPENLARALQDTLEVVSRQPDDPNFRHTFEVIALGWATGRKVRIWYLPARRQETRTHVIWPYFMEPGIRALYVVAHTETYDRVITFKMERIRQAELLDETFELPEDFLPARILRQSWGIIWDESVEEVVLRFSPEVARRVDESVWHPSQEVEELPDGGRLMRLRVSGTLEIEPWIKSWGNAVEVLTPQHLREKMAAEARALAAMYEDG